MNEKRLKVLNAHSALMPLQSDLNALQKIYRISLYRNSRILIPMDILGIPKMLCPDSGEQLTITEYYKIIKHA